MLFFLLFSCINQSPTHSLLTLPPFCELFLLRKLLLLLLLLLLLFSLLFSLLLQDDSRCSDPRRSQKSIDFSADPRKMGCFICFDARKSQEKKPLNLQNEVVVVAAAASAYATTPSSSSAHKFSAGNGSQRGQKLRRETRFRSVRCRWIYIDSFLVIWSFMIKPEDMVFC